jgi:hypothetical protein
MQIYSTLLFLFIVLCLLLKFPRFPTPTPKLGLSLETREKRDCLHQTVRCVDDCDHLCSGNNKFLCLHHTCVSNPSQVNCNADKGGMLVLKGVSDWQCLCKYPHIYNGPSCDDKNPLFCEEGNVVHRFKGIECDCPHPKIKIDRNGFSYCKTLKGIGKWTEGFL